MLISSSRLVEVGVRAPILLAPGLFRLDLTPQEETLGVLTRPLGPHPAHWRADQSTWDGYRDEGETAPLELHALFELPDGPWPAGCTSSPSPTATPRPSTSSPSWSSVSRSD